MNPRARRIVSISSLAIAFVLLCPAALREARAQPVAQAAKPDAAKAADAKAHLAAAAKAASDRAWPVALAEYSAAYAAVPSAKALSGVGEARYQLHQFGAAYDAFADVLRTYAPALKKSDKAAAAARLKELAALTGFLSIRVSEPEATVSLDGKVMGTSPVPALVRVAVGPHRVQVTKEGFVPFDQQTHVTPDGKEIVDVALMRDAKLGKLTVREKAGQPIRVLLDGVDVGAAPWDGDVEPGRHEVSGRGVALVASAQVVEVVQGKPTEVELVASSITARLVVKTSDNKGLIFIDGNPVGEGSVASDVAVGPHVIEVTRDGYEPYRKQVTLGEPQTHVESVTLRSMAPSRIGAGKSNFDRAFEGTYGGIALLGVIEPGNSGNEVDTRCREIGASSCRAPSPLGGGLFGYVGYSFNPIGFELMLGGLADETEPTARFEQAPGPDVNLASTSPRREEKFLFVRAGGIAALQVRYSTQGRLIRGSLAAGVGLAYKVIAMKRTATGIDPGTTSRQSAFVPDPVTYLSPAVTFDGSIQIRLGPTTALSLGGVVWMENAGNGAASKPERYGYSSVLAGGTPDTITPIPTPSYLMASGAQVFVGPYVGVQFGP